MTENIKKFLCDELTQLSGGEKISIQEDKNIRLYGIDSVKIMTLICDIEDKYNITIEEEDIHKFESVNKIEKLIRHKLHSHL